MDIQYFSYHGDHTHGIIMVSSPWGQLDTEANRCSNTHKGCINNWHSHSPCLPARTPAKIKSRTASSSSRTQVRIYINVHVCMWCVCVCVCVRLVGCGCRRETAHKQRGARLRHRGLDWRRSLRCWHVVWTHRVCRHMCALALCVCVCVCVYVCMCVFSISEVGFCDR